jgi:hypothetical protein
MSYLSKVLRPGETILAEGKLHWIIYFPIIIWLVGGVIASVVVGAVEPGVGVWTFVLFACIALLYVVPAWLKRWTTEIAVTDRRVIYKSGLLRRHTAEMNMDNGQTIK